MKVVIALAFCIAAVQCSILPLPDLKSVQCVNTFTAHFSGKLAELMQLDLQNSWNINCQQFADGTTDTAVAYAVTQIGIMHTYALTLPFQFPIVSKLSFNEV